MRRILALLAVLLALAAPAARSAHAQQRPCGYACVTLRTDPAAVAARRDAMEHLRAALAVPPGDAAAHDAGLRTPEDDAATEHFRNASRTADGWIGALAIAASTPDTGVARRVLAAEPGAAAFHAFDRAVPLLLVLADAPDPVTRALATGWLAKGVTQSLRPATERLVVQHALAHWPADARTLRSAPRSGCPTAPAPGLPSFVRGLPHDVASTLLQLAASTGDRSVIARLLPAPRAGEPATPPEALAPPWFVRECLIAAAPRVEPDVARMLHACFLPDIANGIPERRDHRRYAGLRVLVGLFGTVPDELLPSYAALLRQREGNELLRRHARDCAHFPPERLPWLARRDPLGDDDGVLLLRAPRWLRATLRGNGVARDEAITLLVQCRPGNCRRWLWPTAADWHALLPVVAELPPRPRSEVLGALRQGFESAGIDVPRLLQHARVERAVGEQLDPLAEPRSGEPQRQ